MKCAPSKLHAHLFVGGNVELKGSCLKLAHLICNTFAFLIWFIDYASHDIEIDRFNIIPSRYLIVAHIVNVHSYFYSIQEHVYTITFEKLVYCLIFCLLFYKTPLFQF